MNLDGLKKLLGQMMPVQAGMGMAQGVAKGVGQAMKNPQALGTGGFGRLMQQGMPMGPMTRDNEITNEMVRNAQLPLRSLEINQNPDYPQTPFGFPIPGGMNKPRFFEDGSYSRDPRGGLNIPRSMPGMQMFEDNSYIDRRY